MLSNNVSSFECFVDILMNYCHHKVKDATIFDNTTYEQQYIEVSSKVVMISALSFLFTANFMHDDI